MKFLRPVGSSRNSQVTAASEDSDNEDNTELYTYEESSDDGDKSWARSKAFKDFERSGETEAWQRAATLRSKLIAFLNKPAERCMSQPQSDSEAVFKIMAKRQESERALQQGEQEQVMLSSFRFKNTSQKSQEFQHVQPYSTCSGTTFFCHIGPSLYNHFS